MLQRLNVLAACALLALPMAVSAQEGKYPSRPVRILVPFTAGTNADMVARLFAQKLTERLGQPFVVDNRAGAGGVVASQAWLRAPADGYVLMLVSSAHAANPSLNKNLPYDTTRAFSGIAMVGDSAIVVVAHPSLGAKTQADLVAIAKQNPGRLDYSSAGLAAPPISRANTSARKPASRCCTYPSRAPSTSLSAEWPRARRLSAGWPSGPAHPRWHPRPLRNASGTAWSLRAARRGQSWSSSLARCRPL